MKVSIIGTRGYPSYYGGFETLVRNLAPYLVAEGWEVDVYSRRGQVQPDEAISDPALQAVYTAGLDKRSLSTLSFGLTSALHARRAKPDVALVMNVANGYWLPILRRAGIPTVVNVDGIEWDRAKWGNAAKKVFRQGAELTARYADELVFDSTEIGNYWRENFAKSGTFIPYGADFDPAKNVETGFVKGEYILYVARFVPENSIEEFLDAVQQLESETVVIVGSSGFDGEYDQRATALAETKPNVHYLGHVKDDNLLFTLWAEAGAYFHGHTVGGTNPALVQAMACGAPTVARDTKYNREVLGSSGIFVDDDATAIVQSLRNLLSDASSRTELALGAQQRAQDVYTWDGVCSAYAKLILAAVEKNRTPSRS